MGLADCIRFSATMRGLSTSPVTRDISLTFATSFWLCLQTASQPEERMWAQYSRSLSLSWTWKKKQGSLTCPALCVWAHWNLKEKEGSLEERYALIKHSPWDCNVVSDLATKVGPHLSLDTLSSFSKEGSSLDNGYKIQISVDGLRLPILKGWVRQHSGILPL